MALELGDVIAQIGGDGGGVDAVPRRYVHDFGHTPIPADSVIAHEVPDVPEGATLVVTLEWAGPETGEPVMIMRHASGAAAVYGVAAKYDGSWFPPVTVVATASGEERGMFFFAAAAEGYTATRLTAIIIPAIK